MYSFVDLFKSVLIYFDVFVAVQAAEQLLSRDGEFLVRDSSSSTGEYVLSCMWKNQPMHFKIIRVVLRPKQV